MTDEEVICAFMEPRPVDGDAEGSVWWDDRDIAICFGHKYVTVPVPLNLDRLREVESRLTDEQRTAYADYLLLTYPHREPWCYIHATPAQKITALAAVLKGENS